MWKGHAPSRRYTAPWLRLKFWIAVENFATRRRFKAVADLQKSKGVGHDRAKVCGSR